MVDRIANTSQVVPSSPPEPSISPAARTGAETPSFQRVLEGKLRFSRHAAERLARRNIPLGENELARLEEAVERAEKKGAKESLVMVDELAFVVSIRNRTVITAIGPENRKEGVFTNIDSVVLM